MTREPPEWHERARQLAAAGWTREAIAAEVDRSLGSVYAVLCPGTREGQRRRWRARNKRKWADPEHRAKANARARKRWAAARAERERIKGVSEQKRDVSGRFLPVYVPK